MGGARSLYGVPRGGCPCAAIGAGPDGTGSVCGRGRRWEQKVPWRAGAFGERQNTRMANLPARGSPSGPVPVEEVDPIVILGG